MLEEIVDVEIKKDIPIFDKKYKKIIHFQYEDVKSYIEIIEWVNKNTKNSVDIKPSIETNSFYIAFENVNDSLLFKIKYGC